MFGLLQKKTPNQTKKQSSCSFAVESLWTNFQKRNYADCKGLYVASFENGKVMLEKFLSLTLNIVATRDAKSVNMVTPFQW